MLDITSQYITRFYFSGGFRTALGGGGGVRVLLWSGVRHREMELHRVARRGIDTGYEMV